jgi:hypothetical protein
LARNSDIVADSSDTISCLPPWGILAVKVRDVKKERHCEPVPSHEIPALLVTRGVKGATGDFNVEKSANPLVLYPVVGAAHQARDLLVDFHLVMPSPDVIKGGIARHVAPSLGQRLEIIANSSQLVMNAAIYGH